MSATPATVWGVLMTSLTGNTGGAIETLGASYQNGKERAFVETLVFATQTNGTVIGVARIPLFAIMLGIIVCTDTSTSSATIKFGDAGNGNSAIYGAAAAVTSTDTPTTFAKTATFGKQITTGYDSTSGAAVTAYAPGQGGAIYEDVIMTIGGANFPGSGNLTIITKYAID